MKKIIGALVFSFGVMFLAVASPGTGSYEAYYLFLGNYPNEANPGWHEEAQGLTHDRDNWFISQKEYLWKIPVTHNLNSVSPTAPGVKRIGLGGIPELKDFNHFGDPDYYEFEGRGYVIVPLEHVDDHKPCNAIAVFRADSLKYIACQCLPEQEQAPWVAVDPKGNLFSSNSETGKDKKPQRSPKESAQTQGGHE